MHSRGFSIGRFILYTTMRFHTQLKYDEVQYFFEANPPKGGAAAVAQALEAIHSNMVWLAKNGDDACRWLMTY